MRKGKREGVIGLMLREQAKSRQRTHGQTPAIAWIVLKVVDGEKLVSLGKVVIEPQGRKIPGEQSRNVSDKPSQPPVRGRERSRRIRVRVIPVHDVQGDWIEQPCRNGEPASGRARENGVVGQLSRRE